MSIEYVSESETHHYFSLEYKKDSRISVSVSSVDSLVLYDFVFFFCKQRFTTLIDS